MEAVESETLCDSSILQLITRLPVEIHVVCPLPVRAVTSGKPTCGFFELPICFRLQT